MQYSTYVAQIIGIITGTTHTFTGFTFKYWEFCLEDEIELSNVDAGFQYPAMFITPQPYQFISETGVKYVIRIYLAQTIDKNDRRKRIQAFNDMNNAANWLVEWIPDWMNGVTYPIQIVPVLLWDANVDGLYFDLEFVVQRDC